MLNVNPLLLSHVPDFRIEVEEDHLILHGSAEESAGVILRGSVILNCREHTKVRSITLKFLGKINVHWTEGQQKQQKDERILISKEWTFLPFNKKTYQLDGEYKWQFELPLAGNLPQSIHHELGQVSYQLKAHCDRPTFSLNYVDKKTITISRCMLPTSIEFSQSLIVANTWANKLNYNISIPTKIFGADSIIPVYFNLNPLASSLKVKSISCFLREYTTFSTKEKTRTLNKMITHLFDRHITCQNNHYIKTENVYVPSYIRHDMNHSMIKVKHKIKFTVILQNGDGHVSELRASIPVIIVSSTSQDDENALPMYEENVLSSDVASLYTTVNNTSLPWAGMDISRVPSYRTALRTSHIPCHLSPSLPTYESALLT